MLGTFLIVYSVKVHVDLAADSFRVESLSWYKIMKED